jgi:hypothetical protein
MAEEVWLPWTSCFISAIAVYFNFASHDFISAMTSLTTVADHFVFGMTNIDSAQTAKSLFIFNICL